MQQRQAGSDLESALPFPTYRSTRVGQTDSTPLKAQNTMHYCLLHVQHSTGHGANNLPRWGVLQWSLVYLMATSVNTHIFHHSPS